MATFCPDGLCIAELGRGESKGQQFELFSPKRMGVNWGEVEFKTHQTTP